MWYHYFEMKDVTPRNILFMFSIREIDGKYSFKVGCNLVCIKRYSHKYLKNNHNSKLWQNTIPPNNNPSFDINQVIWIMIDEFQTTNKTFF